MVTKKTLDLQCHYRRHLTYIMFICRYIHIYYSIDTYISLLHTSLLFLSLAFMINTQILEKDTAKTHAPNLKDLVHVSCFHNELPQVGCEPMAFNILG